MNTSKLFGELLLRYFKTPIELPEAPRYRLNHIIASEMCEKVLNFIKREDPDGHAAQRGSLVSLARTFNETMSPTEYLTHNEALWDSLYAMLQPLKPPTGQAAAKRVPYAFTNILAELPDTRRWLEAAHESDPSGGNGRMLGLMANESSLLGLVNPSVDTLTFYEGAAPVDALRERLRLMAAANPWLAGRLISGDAGAVKFWVPHAADASVAFADESLEGLRADTPPQECIEACAAFSVKLGLECVDVEEPLFRVTLLRTGEDHFALHASLSHTIGDAATFYALYTMLDPSGPPPTSMDPARLPAFNLDITGAVFGAQFTAGHTRLQSSKPKGVSDALRMFQAGSKSKARQKGAALHLISNEWIKSEKQAYAAAATASGFDFLSTNDLLAGWYYKSSGANMGTLAVDCRGRLPGVPDASDLRPGNYLAPIYLAQDDFASPVDVRQKVTKTLKRMDLLSTSASRELPPVGAPQVAGAPRVSNVTNWSAVYYHLTFAECRHVAHFPVLNSLQDATHGNMYLFRPRPGELAALNFFKGDDDGSADSPFLPWRA